MFKNIFNNFFSLACVIFLMIFFVATDTRAAQTGGGYVVQDHVTSITGATSGGGISSQVGGDPVSQTVTGNGITSYGGAFATSVVPVVVPPVTSGGGGGGSVSSGGGGSSGGGAFATVTGANKNTQVAAVAPLKDQIACSEKITISKPIRYSLFSFNNKADVEILQRFLNTYEGANLTVNGKYGKKDFDAVVLWQEKYADIILKPWGLKKGTGYVYTTSMAQMKKQQRASCSNEVVRQTEPPQTVIKVQCPYFTEYLNEDTRGKVADIKKIQEFLNREVAAGLQIDGNYDFETKFAVKLFQKKYSDEILSFWSLKIPSGKWHKKTVQKANELLGCRTN